MNKFYLFTSFAFLLFLSSCYYDNKEDLFQTDTDCETTLVGYAAVIQPIIDTRCYNCHAAAVELGGINLEDFSSLKNYVDNEKFITSIKHEAGASAMPPGGVRIPDCEILKIEAWIANGALND